MKLEVFGKGKGGRNKLQGLQDFKFGLGEVDARISIRISIE